MSVATAFFVFRLDWVLKKGGLFLKVLLFLNFIWGQGESQEKAPQGLLPNFYHDGLSRAGVLSVLRDEWVKCLQFGVVLEE